MKNCLIIPTYPPHFGMTKRLISSISIFNEDTIPPDIFVIINKEFKNAFPSPKFLCKELYIEDILSDLFDINIDPNVLLSEYCDKYSFQSIKKITAIRYVTHILNYDNVYTMDSEGAFIRHFSFTKTIKDYLETKKIYYYSTKIKTNQCKISCEIFNKETPGWLLENYLWIYEKKIVEDFFRFIFKNINTVVSLTDTIKKGTFIEILYYHFIYLNNDKYNYKFIDTNDLLKFCNTDILEVIKKRRKKQSLLEDIRIIIRHRKDSIDFIMDYFVQNNIINFRLTGGENNFLFLKKNKNIVCCNSSFLPCQWYSYFLKNK